MSPYLTEVSARRYTLRFSLVYRCARPAASVEHRSTQLFFYSVGIGAIAGMPNPRHGLYR